MKKLLIVVFLFSAFCAICQTKTDSIPKKWKIKGELNFIFNQSSFSNWVAGGYNTIAGNLRINYDFNYKNNNWNWDNKLVTVFGLSHVSEKGFRKTEDRFNFNSLLGKKSKNYWYFSFFNNFKTQYTRGYNYKKTPKISVSNFLAPAYWSFGPGMLWKKSENARLNIAPATSRYTFVSDEFSGSFGVQEGRNTNFGLGFNLSAYFKYLLMEDVTMENTLTVYSDYLDKPQNIDIDYQVNFFVKVNKYLSMNLGFHMIIDDNASSKIQLKEVFGLGVNYIFHKK
ncbi:DUF3078 domain-containing protein [Tenacibaculum sp.]|nr:DUF3078 domain-containing protein [Tenacibaculum sp.]